MENSSAATIKHAIYTLPTPVLAKAIAYSDPHRWWHLNNLSVRAIINTTSFRCEWLCSLATSSKVPLQPTSVGDIVDAACRNLNPVTDLVGSNAWISENLIYALKSKRPVLLNTLAPCLVWTMLLDKKQNLASVVTKHSGIEIDMLNGQLVRALLESKSELWMLEWLDHNSPRIFSTDLHGSCFSMSIFTSWAINNQIDLLSFLAQRHIHLPIRSLLEHALGHSNPTTVEFLVHHSSDHSNGITWNDLLMMACTDATTRLDVFQHIVGNTEPSIVWTFAACCLASHAMLDVSAHKKFTVLRNAPQAELWLTQSLRGRTPIECLCERITYENLSYLSPFIRDYIDLGVPTAGMPSIVSMLCQ
ncbi:hypothetical protein GGI25_002620 [Coemansia spiralis]|uniref:Uncharacterized protein n=2 Tax=Coemansia TaxID=4863 RepID=A0A9W8G8A8_9FUNG|nr:hypothetical protein BX070DRAFT_252946 [Coemansia spiralis]KAJ1989806.1 hypothetical protein EDC05_004426 [Coemansia umbellata]KAJ2620597.1 hypothetical protein GGI26_004829 [Coemansia sp. RSA 1358]KAJ2678116.1 hypothetical protein GGI25_002620 [Coemansia spiralis]